MTERQLDHGLFVGFAPAENPEIAIAVVWENGRHGGSAAQLARPIFDYWLVTRKKNPIRPANHQIEWRFNRPRGLNPVNYQVVALHQRPQRGQVQLHQPVLPIQHPLQQRQYKPVSATPPSAPVE